MSQDTLRKEVLRVLPKRSVVWGVLQMRGLPQYDYAQTEPPFYEHGE